jgi:hypothetical protein
MEQCTKILFFDSEGLVLEEQSMKVSNQKLKLLQPEF